MSVHPATFRQYRARMAVLTKELSRVKGITADQADALVRGLIGQITGGESSTLALDALGWEALFRWFGDQGVRLRIVRDDAPILKATHSGGHLLSTDRQRRVLNTVRELNGMSEEDYHEFCSSRFGFRSPSTRSQANKVIDALKPMALRLHQVETRIARALTCDLDPRDRVFLVDVYSQFSRGKQGAKVRVGSIPIALKVLARHGVGITHRKSAGDN